ncbi:MAG: ketopantoate reductase family protein [bacterium]
MNIAVVGVGGVGGYFGGKLTKLLDSNLNHKIHFIARGNHLKKIIRNGLILDAEEGTILCRPTTATDDISTLPMLDICMICVKSYDLNNILKQLQQKIMDNTIILPLLNGVDIVYRIRNNIKQGIILPSCVYIGSHIKEPGIVIQRGGSCIIHTGRDPQSNNLAEDNKFINNLLNLLNKAEIKYNWHQNPYNEIWSKFMFIASFGLVTAAFKKSIGEVLESKELSTYVKNTMNEISNIAKYKRIDLEKNIIEKSFKKAIKFPYETKTSFQRDFEQSGKKDERDLFGGVIIRLGRESGINVQTTEYLYGIIEKNN